MTPTARPATIQRGAFGQAAAEGLPANPDVGKLIRWDVNASANLPAPRTNASGWAANGAIYLAGGNDGGGPQSELYWAVPTNAGDLPEWKHLAASDLPAPLEGGAPVITGPEAVIVGGVTARLRRRPPRRAGASGSAPVASASAPPASAPPTVPPGSVVATASGPTPHRSARSSSSAWSGRPCPA